MCRARDARVKEQIDRPLKLQKPKLLQSQTMAPQGPNHGRLARALPPAEDGQQIDLNRSSLQNTRTVAVGSVQFPVAVS